MPVEETLHGPEGKLEYSGQAGPNSAGPPRHGQVASGIRGDGDGEMSIFEDHHARVERDVYPAIKYRSIDCQLLIAIFGLW